MNTPLDISKCPSCNCTYDEDTHIPKLLPCNHTQCSFCTALSYAQTGQVTCVFCGPVYFHSSHLLPINHPMLNAVKEVQLDKIALQQQIHSLLMTPAKSPSEFSGSYPSTAFSSETKRSPASSTVLNAWDCARKLNFADYQGITHTTPEESKVPKYASTESLRKSVPTKVVPVEYNLPFGHPAKCVRPECHNKRFVGKDGTVYLYCSRTCERVESVRKT